MRREVDNRNKDCEFNGPYAGRDMYITMYQDSEREFVVTHNAEIKPVSYFTGRETELQELRQRIEEGRKSVLVSGMGGIGKTHICRKLFEEYTNKHANGKNIPFGHIGYIEYNGDMSGSLMNCLKYRQQDDPEQNQEAAWRELEYLASDGKLLLFVDNVNVPIGEDTGLGRLKQVPGAVVLTSRRMSFSKEFEPYRIGFLNTEQCIEIYERIRYENSGKKVPEEEISDLKYVIEDLAGRHTITVELLAHLAWTKTLTVKRLRKELEEKGFCLKFHKDGELVNIQKSYEALYDLSELTEAEQNVLEAFSVFPYIPLAAETCNEWLLADAGVSDDDILIGLYRKGWLQFDIKQESYSMHPVFAQFILEKCKPRIEYHHTLIEECQKSLELPENGAILTCKEYIPFVESIIENVNMGKSEEKIEVINWVSYLFLSMMEYGKAEKLSEECLELSKEVLGEENSDTATICGNLARVYEHEGKYGKAEKLYRKSLKIREKLLGMEDLDIAVSYSDVAVLYEKWGKYGKAEKLYKKSLKIREKLLDEEDIDIAIVYDNLAGLYREQGEYGKAEKLYRKSLEIHEKVLGKGHIDTAMTYNALAGLYGERKEYGKAEKLYRKSLKIREKVLGEEDVYIAMIYSNLAGLYEKKGKYRESEKLYRKCQRIIEKLLGVGHPYTAQTYNNIACVYTRQRKYKEAESMFRKTLQIYEKILGKEHPDTVACYGNLVEIYNKQGKYKEAERLCKKGLQIIEKVLGEAHPDTATSYNNLAYVYYKQGKYRGAEKLFEKSLRIREKVFGKEHLDTAISYNNLANMNYNHKKCEIALSYYVKVYKIYVNQLGANHLETQTVYKNMGLAYSEWNPDGNFEQWLEEQMKE